MTAGEKAAHAISRLLRRTKEGNLVWSNPEARHFPGQQGDDRIDAYFEAVVDDHRLAIFEARTRYVQDDETTSWDKYLQLVILDDNGRVGWRFPMVAGLDTLMDAVRYVSGDVGDFLDSLIAGDAASGSSSSDAQAE